jgi:hypothetical protein
MPISLVDEAGNEIDLEKADGGTLRKKLEEALSKNRELEQRVVTSEVDRINREHGYKLKAEDLGEVPVDQLEAKAKELHEQAQSQRRETIRSVFAERGLEGDDLDQAVEGFLSGADAPGGNPNPQDEIDFGDLPKLGGVRPPRGGDAPSISDPMGNLTAHFEEQERKSGRK